MWAVTAEDLGHGQWPQRTWAMGSDLRGSGSCAVISEDLGCVDSDLRGSELCGQ